MKPTHALRKEHELLLSRIQAFEEVLNALPSLPWGDAGQNVAREVEFLQREIKNHAAAEEKYLYTEVDYLCGHDRNAGVKTSATMAIDHEYIAAYIDRLTGLAMTLSPQTLADFQRTGWELIATLRLHFDKEERVYLTLLDERFTGEEVERRIVRRMEQLEKGTAVELPTEGELLAYG